MNVNHTANHTANYVELHARSFYSFGMGASHVHELLAQAREYGYRALALTDTNLCGGLEFARLADSLGLRPITGGELTLGDGSRLVLLAKTRAGYANLCRLLSRANAVDRREPRLDPARLAEHAQGLILLTGGRDGPLARLLRPGRRREARALLERYREWYGPEGVYVELQQNFLQGDTPRNRESAALARDAGLGVVASNDVLYHCPERHRLQHALAAARRNLTIEEALPYLRPNNHLCLKPPAQMEQLFRQYPEAVANTVRIAEQCGFNLSSDLGYTLPEAEVPAGYTPDSYLRRLCREAAQRRYGGVSWKIEKRLQEEFSLIARHGLAGFLLLYRELVHLAQEIMEERGLTHPETPLEERPPGRGRGSSVALLVGYLIGISHVDPLRWDLTLERFISEDQSLLPDIDLDFPRQLRDELIRRVHQRFGPEHAVLAGAIATYSGQGHRPGPGPGIGAALGGAEPAIQTATLPRCLICWNGRLLALPAFRDRVEAPGWRDLIQLAPQLMGAPKLPRPARRRHGAQQFAPIPELVPTRAGALAGRYLMDWNKDSVADAGFAKIDLLSLPVLDQLEEALDLIEAREGQRPDLGRIDPADPAVYDLINRGQAKGVFLLQSPAQLKLGQRLRSRSLLDLAHQVALIRPGVGVQGSAVAQFVERYRHGAAWEYDHPLEERALERGCGIIVWQEQVVQLVMDLAGMSAAQADEVRRAFAKPNNAQLLALHRRRFLEGAQGNGVPEELAEKIFAKINGQYLFPRKPQPRLCRHRLPGRLAEALPSLGVLRCPGQQPAHGLLPGGDPEAGRPALWRALPEPRRQPQRGELRSRSGFGAAGPAQRQGRGRGVGPGRRDGAGPARPLRRGWRPGAPHRPEAPGAPVPGPGRGLR